MPLVKPFRALRYDVRAAGPLGDLVAPPYDVITAAELERFVSASPYNVVRLIRPYEPELAAERFRAWQAAGVLVRDEQAAVWRLREEYLGPDGVSRTRDALVARVRLDPEKEGVVLPHERTFSEPVQARLRLLEAVGAKLSPIFLLHSGPPPGSPRGAPDLDATLAGVRSSVWRIADPAGIEVELAAIRGPLVIADGHHRYEAALRYHEAHPGEESAYVMAALVSCDDPGLTIFPTHRIVAGALPALNGGFRVTRVHGGAVAAVERLEQLSRDRPAFVLVTRDEVVLAEQKDGGLELRERLDVSAIERLALEGVTFTPSVSEAADAVASGRARGAFLVRAPSIAEVRAIARAGEIMPEKSTYFYPKLASGLLFSPFDE